MNTTLQTTLARQEIEEMLPWHAAGTLSRRDAQRVEDALRNDAELARQFALVREEFSETIHLNETLGAPSSRAMERLMAGIEAESGPARAPRFSLSAWLSETFSAASPRKLAWAGSAAAVISALQAGLIGSMVLGDRGTGTPKGGFETASRPATETMTGSFALVGFAPQATAADITKFLDANQLAVVDGPRAGGMYRVRISKTPVAKDEAARIASRLGSESAIVRFIAPTE